MRRRKLLSIPIVGFLVIIFTLSITSGEEDFFKRGRNEGISFLSGGVGQREREILKEMRCVEREGVLDGVIPVTSLRIFRPAEPQQKGIGVEGWETFDQHPDLILFEGYLTRANEAHLERRK